MKIMIICSRHELHTAWRVGNFFLFPHHVWAHCIPIFSMCHLYCMLKVLFSVVRIRKWLFMHRTLSLTSGWYSFVTLHSNSNNLHSCCQLEKEADGFTFHHILFSDSPLYHYDFHLVLNKHLLRSSIWSLCFQKEKNNHSAENHTSRD